MEWRVWLSNISHGSSTWTHRGDITYSTAHIVTPRQLEYQLTPLAHDKETRERLSMRDAFCGGVIFTTTNLSNSQKTAMEIIFIPQVFWRLYVSLIHTIRLGWDQTVWCEAKPVHCSGMPCQHQTGSDRVSPFDCWPCQVQCWHGWSPCSHWDNPSVPCTCGPAGKCLLGSQLRSMALAILAENKATAGCNCWSLNGVLW